MKLPGVSEAPKLAAHANGLHPRMPPEKASKIKPTVVLLSPVISDTLTEIVMTMQLD